MKTKFNFRLLAMAMYLFTITGLISCWGDDERKSTSLEVNVYDIILGAERNSSSTITITSNANWEIKNAPSWISFSSTRGGAGSATIEILASSKNNTAEERVGTFNILAGDKRVSIEVIQRAALTAYCEVNPVNIVTLTDGIAFDFEFGKEVSYYYYGFMEKSLIGSMTDDEIAEYSQENFVRYTPYEDHLGVIDGLYPNTEYYIIAFGYDSEGYRGTMNKILMKTKAQKTNRPRISISDVSYTYNEWNWNTYMSAYTTKYYMMASSGITAYIYGELYADVEIAWLMKQEIDNETLDPILNNGSWTMDKDAEDADLYIAAWAVGGNDYSGEMDIFYGSINYDSSIQKVSMNKEEKKVRVYNSSKSELRSRFSKITE